MRLTLYVTGQSLETARDFLHDYNGDDCYAVAALIEEIRRQERAKWLPLFEAVKELEMVDDFYSDRPDRYYTAGGFQGLNFSTLSSTDQSRLMAARREIRQVLLNLRSQGER